MTGIDRMTLPAGRYALIRTQYGVRLIDPDRPGAPYAPDHQMGVGGFTCMSAAEVVISCYTIGDVLPPMVRDFLREYCMTDGYACHAQHLLAGRWLNDDELSALA